MSEDTQKKVVMSWTSEKDVMLLREVAAEGVFYNNFGSRERGAAWNTVASNLNSYPDFEVTARSVRDRYGILAKKHKSKNSQERKESGGGGKEPTEGEVLLEDLLEIADATEKKCEQENEKKKELNEQDRKKAIDIRDKAMERFGETRKRHGDAIDQDESNHLKKKVAAPAQRRSPSNTLEWLREKGVEEKRLREKEFELKKEELELMKAQQQHATQQLKAQQQNQEENMKLLQNQMLLQMRQQQQQQEQQQQQFLIMQQQMLAAIQQLSNIKKEH